MNKKNDITSEIGERIIALRKQMRLQQKEMANELNIAASYLCEIESGRAKPNIELLIKMASLYNVNLNYLLMGTGDMMHGPGRKMKPEGFDFTDGIDSLEEMFWLMENSKFFRNAIMSMANKLIIEEEAVIKKGIKKTASK